MVRQRIGTLVCRNFCDGVSKFGVSIILVGQILDELRKLVGRE
jgi:hypothetical protein